MEALPLGPLLDSFALDLRSQNKSPRTIAVYREGVNHFRRWLRAVGAADDTSSLRRDYVRAWQAEILASRSVGTAATHFRGLRRFVRFLVSEEFIERDPLDGLREPRAPAEPVQLLSDEELKRLLAVCRGRSFTDLRDTAIFRVLISTGLRVGELVSMRVDDVDLTDSRALVSGKGGKVRPVYFAAKTARALDRYLWARRRHRYAHLPELWIGERGALGEAAIRYLCRTRGREAGIEGLHPHRLRHNFAHSWLRRGGAEGNLMRLAGWSSRDMLSRYGAAGADMRARAEYERLRPGDDL